MTGRDITLAGVAAVIWGATFPVSAIALEQTPPLFFTFLRFLCAAAFVCVVPRPRVGWVRLFSLGLLLGAGQYGAMFVAMSQGVPAGMAAVLVHTQAIITVVLAMIFLQERPRQSAVFAIVLASVGLGCLAVTQYQGGQVVGFVLMLVAASSAAIGNLILKSSPPEEMLGVAVWMSAVPVLPLLTLSMILEPLPSLDAAASIVPVRTLLAVIYSGVAATVVAYGIWGRLLARYPASAVAPFFLAVPMVGLCLSAFVLGERPTQLQWAGFGLIMLALMMSVGLPSGRQSQE